MSHRARRFHDLHQAGSFVLPNAWDAASAAVIAAAGAPAVATSSSGMSWSLGVPDGEHLSREETVAAVARIARVVDVPVSADVESGYGSPRPTSTSRPSAIRTRARTRRSSAASATRRRAATACSCRAWSTQR